MQIVFKSNKSNLPLKRTVFHLKDKYILCGIDKRFPAIYHDNYGSLEDNEDVRICKKCNKINNKP